MKKIDKKAIMAEIVLNKTLITTLLTKQKDFILKKIASRCPLLGTFVV